MAGRGDARRDPGACACRPPGPGATGKYLMVPGRVRARSRARPRRHDVLVVRGTRVLGLPGLVAGARCAGLRRRAAARDQRRARAARPSPGASPGRAGRPGRLAPGAIARCATAGCATPTRSWPCRGRSGTRCWRPACPRERVALLPARRRHRRASGRPTRASARPCGRGSACPTGVARRLHGPAAARQGARDAARGVRGGRAPSAPTCASLLVGSGEGQALSVEDELRRRAAERGPRRRASSSPGGASASRTGCARRTSSCSRRSSRRSASRSSRPRPAACRRSAAAPAGSWT